MAVDKDDLLTTGEGSRVTSSGLCAVRLLQRRILRKPDKATTTCIRRATLTGSKSHLHRKAVEKPPKSHRWFLPRATFRFPVLTRVDRCISFVVTARKGNLRNIAILRNARIMHSDLTLPPINGVEQMSRGLALSLQAENGNTAEDRFSSHRPCCFTNLPHTS